MCGGVRALAAVKERGLLEGIDQTKHSVRCRERASLSLETKVPAKVTCCELRLQCSGTMSVTSAIEKEHRDED